MRNPNPQPQGVQYDAFRYTNDNSGDDSSPRYDPFRGRDVPVAPYNYMGTTLEEEAYNGGWRPQDRPTSTTPFVHGSTSTPLARDAQPRELMTIGMRGEPGWDDDPTYGLDGNYHHDGTSGQDISDSD